MAGVPGGAQASEEVQQADASSDTGKTSQDAVQVATSSDAAAGKKVLAQSSGAPEITTAKKEVAQASVPGVSAVSPGGSSAGGAERKYALAPIKWNGSVSAGLLWSKGTYENHSHGFGNVETAKIQASTYILASYIAKVRGGIGFVHSTQNTKTPGVVDNRKNNLTLIGNADVSLFSYSRYPIKMGVDVSDSRALDVLTNDNRRSKRFIAEQEYKKPRNMNMWLGWNYGITSTQTDTIKELIATGTATFHGLPNKQESLDAKLNISRDDVRNSIAGESFTTERSLAMQRTYLPFDSLWSSATSVRLINTGQGSVDGGVLARNFYVDQIFSWQPEDEDLNVFVNGGVNLADTRTSYLSSVSTSHYLGGNVTATDIVSQNLRYTASGRVGLNVSAGRIGSGSGVGGKRTMAAEERVGAAYRADPYKMGKATYGRNWSVGLIADQASGGVRADQKITGSVGHSLGLPLDYKLFKKAQHFFFSVSQGLVATHGRILGNEVVLRNDLNAAWHTQWGGARAGVTLGVGNVRTWGRNPSSVPKKTRTISFDVVEDGTAQYRSGGWRLKGTVQAHLDVTGHVVVNVLGNAIYTKPRPFGVRGLTYQGSLLANPGQLNAGGPSTSVASQASQPSYSLVQQLRYRIGMNEALFTADMSSTGGHKSGGLYLQLRAWRNFGN
ncbi:MAG: hypothetical protein HY306_12685 [Nitrosomonadales bacterium]|nr:hypothetical protein [Nitrosomonadales bacterium]